MPITGNDVVVSALMKAGVVGKGRPPDSYDSNNALGDLNDMIASWNTERWIQWDILDLGLVADGSTAGYTIGPGGDFDTGTIERPQRLTAGYVKQLVNSGLPVNTPLEIIPSREQYSRLSLPQLVSFPLYLFLDTSFPLGTVHVYPNPNANIYEVHVLIKNAIGEIDLTTDLSVLPRAYIPAFKFNLAKRLRQSYGKGAMRPDTELDRLASSSLNALIEANTQIPELVMPKVLITQSSGYNILSDQFGNG